MDSTDRDLLALLQHDATQSYAALGEAVGCPPARRTSGCASCGSGE